MGGDTNSRKNLAERLDRLEEENRKLKDKVDKLSQENEYTSSDEEINDEAGVSRRQFLKMLGLGAGSLALSSVAAGTTWSKVTPRTQGTSDIKSEVAMKGLTGSSSSFDIDGTTKTLFSVQDGGPVKVKNTSLKINSGLKDGSGSLMAQSVVATGQVSLSSGTAVVDTGISVTDATFTLALGIDNPNADAKVSGRIFWDDSAGTYKVEIVEQTAVNPTVNYDVVRVR